MARKQMLINYHTSGVTSMPLASDVAFGEIVVRHADEKPELLIKKNGGDFAVIPDSVAVASAITNAVTVSEGNINAAIANVKEAMSAHTTEFNTYKENAAKEFATKTELNTAKADLNGAISSAKTEVYASATTFATNAVSAATEILQGEIADVRAAINEANSGATKFEDFVEKNYATSADTEAAVSKAKDEAVGAASAYTDAEVSEALISATTFANSAVTAAKNELQGEINGVAADVAENAKAIEDAAKHVAETYATSARTVDAIAVAKNEAIGAASAYTDAEVSEALASAKTFATNAVSAATEELQGQIDDVVADVADNAKAIEDAAKHVAETFATSADTVSAITNAKNEAIAAASAYTDAEIAEVYGSATTFATNAVSAATEILQGEIEALESELNSGITSVRNEMSAATENLTELINNKVAVAYRFQGTCTYAELTAKTASMTDEMIGYVWNVTDANGDFPAGTNYAWDGENWDALGGSVDLSPYAKVADFNAYKEEVAGDFEDVLSKISEANSGTTILEDYVNDTFATSADTVSAITNAKNEAIAAASAYTDAEVSEALTSATTFATNAVSAATEALQGNIDAVDAKVNTLSAATITIQTTANSAVQSASVDEASKVSVKKEGTELKFDFSNLVIDCGEFI